MTKLNTKIVPLTFERYQSLITRPAVMDQAVQCDETTVKPNILEATPYKSKAERLLLHLQENDMDCDLRGRLVLGSQTVANTNLAQMIKDVCSDEETPIESRHSRDFFKLLVLTKFDFKDGEPN
jgi:hypothetical protein